MFNNFFDSNFLQNHFIDQGYMVGFRVECMVDF